MSRAERRAQAMTWAGAVSAAFSRETGTLVAVIDNRSCSWQDDGGWLTVCDDHSAVVRHDTRRQAAWHAPMPHGWCEECSAR